MLIIFDLDGTLIDSAQDLAISMNATRRSFGMTPLDERLIFSYVGNGAPVLVRRAMGPDASEQLVKDALVFFLKYYRVHALEHTRLYPGVRELIDQLVQDEHQLGVLTNKPVRISFDIIDALGLSKHFFRVYGGDSLNAKKPDPVGIRSLMKEASATCDTTLMVGDSAIDVRTARNSGVGCCGVAWGFQPDSFQSDPPDAVISKPQELLSVLSRYPFTPPGCSAVESLSGL